MASAQPKALLENAYEEAAQAYLRSLPLEHFMEATEQATQRKITLESLDLLHARCPEVQVFNELLVQYPVPGQPRFGQVVPDNMVVRCDQPIRAKSSFNTSLEPAKPFWMLEYVSASNRRKDYKDNFQKYERDLKVPYYLIFDPDALHLNLYRHTGRKYAPVRANKQDRYPIPELELEVGLLDGWVRFWHQGQLLPLPGELQSELEESKRRADALLQRAEQAEAARQAAEQEAAHLRAQLEQLQKRRRKGS
jgi:hypothetical protein